MKRVWNEELVQRLREIASQSRNVSISCSKFLNLSSSLLYAMYEICNFIASAPVTRPCKTSLNPKVVQLSCILAHAVPVVEREVEEPPPFVVLVQGPPSVGKTTLIKNLIKHYTRQNVGEVKGPITLISGKSRRLTFIECPQASYQRSCMTLPLKSTIDSRTSQCKPKNLSGGSWHLLLSLLMHVKSPLKFQNR